MSQMSSLSNTYDPVHVSHWESVHFSTTQKLPARELLSAIHKLLYFLRCSCPEARDVSIEDQAEGYEWHDIGEKQMGRRPPEYHRRV
jgi:hypothetical protein